MGVLVFVLAIAPLNKGNGESLHLLRAESPGPDVGKLTPTMRHTARMLYLIYIVLTLVLIALLLAGGMPLFDSIVHAYGTAGTGGFSIKNASIAAYPSYYLQAVIAVFMALFGINFNQYYYLITGRRILALRNEEFRSYVGIMVAATLIIAVNIYGVYGNVRDALHHSFFQVSSIMTTTGYATADFDKWPQLSRLLLLGLMVVGASAGSTGGGMKVARIVILWKSLKAETMRMLHPRSIKVLMMDGKRIEGNVLRGVYAFSAAYIIILALSILLVSLDNFDMDTTVSAVFSCVGNIGPGLSVVGPLGNFGVLSDFSKLILTMDMLLGRLEIFPLVLLFSPNLWRKLD
jgi:trk system potassium uptake protein TrkH